MIASRRIFIVSSSHPYHNCKIPFLYEHVMTPSMTPRRRRYLFLLSPSHHAHLPRISSLHQSCLPSIRIPYPSRSSRACVTFARPRSPLLATPSISQKFYIIELLSDTSLASGSFRLHPVYHVLSELSLLSYLYQYLLHYPRIFILFRHLDLFLILHSTLGCLGRSLW
jgi:hypothetical protein